MLQRGFCGWVDGVCEYVMCGGVCVYVCVCVGLRAEYRGGLSGEPAGKYSQQSSDVYERGWVAVAGFVWVVCWFVWLVVLCCVVACVSSFGLLSRVFLLGGACACRPV